MNVIEAVGAGITVGVAVGIVAFWFVIGYRVVRALERIADVVVKVESETKKDKP